MFRQSPLSFQVPMKGMYVQNNMLQSDFQSFRCSKLERDVKQKRSLIEDYRRKQAEFNGVVSDKQAKIVRNHAMLVCIGLPNLDVVYRGNLMRLYRVGLKLQNKKSKRYRSQVTLGLLLCAVIIL